MDSREQKGYKTTRTHKTQIKLPPHQSNEKRKKMVFTRSSTNELIDLTSGGGISYRDLPAKYKACIAENGRDKTLLFDAATHEFIYKSRSSSLGDNRRKCVSRKMK